MESPFFEILSLFLYPVISQRNVAKFSPPTAAALAKLPKILVGFMGRGIRYCAAHNHKFEKISVKFSSSNNSNSQGGKNNSDFLELIQSSKCVMTEAEPGGSFDDRVSRPKLQTVESLLAGIVLDPFARPHRNLRRAVQGCAYSQGR
jgi:hypothetical protein